MNHNFKLEFVDSGLYFVHDENGFLNQLFLVESGYGFPGNGSEDANPYQNETDPQHWAH